MRAFRAGRGPRAAAKEASVLLPDDEGACWTGGVPPSPPSPTVESVADCAEVGQGGRRRSTASSAPRPRGVLTPKEVLGKRRRSACAPKEFGSAGGGGALRKKRKARAGATSEEMDVGEQNQSIVWRLIDAAEAKAEEAAGVAPDHDKNRAFLVLKGALAGALKALVPCGHCAKDGVLRARESRTYVLRMPCPSVLSRIYFLSPVGFPSLLSPFT